MFLRTLRPDLVESTDHFGLAGLKPCRLASLGLPTCSLYIGECGRRMEVDSMSAKLNEMVLQTAVP